MKKIDLHEKYNEFQKNYYEPASEDTRTAYDNLRGALSFMLEEYLDAIEEQMWIQGFEYAMKLKEGDK